MAAYPGDYAKVHNQSDETLVLTWDGRSAKIGPGQVGLATFEQVINHFGHPAAGESEQKITDPTGAFHVVPKREDERRRVSIKQGWDLRSQHTGGLQTLVAPPPVAIYDQDDNRIWTVAEDPDGEHVMVSASTPGAPIDQIAYLQRQLDMLRAAQVNAAGPDLSAPGLTKPGSSPAGELPDLVDVPTDD